MRIKNKSKNKIENYIKKLKLQEAGITLIALVVTIIILLILAGVSISTLTGENSLIQKTKQASEISKKESLIEQVKMDIVAQEIENNGESINKSQLKTILDKYFVSVPESNNLSSETEITAMEKYGGSTIKISELYDGGYSNNSTTTYQDSNGDRVTIPGGYKVSEKAGENTVRNGLVIINELNGNEFVWIPCTTSSTTSNDNINSEIQFSRTKWDTEYEKDPTTPGTEAWKDELELTGATVSDTEKANGLTTDVLAEIVAQIQTEKASVTKYGGYYIARYEVGRERQSSTEAKIQPNLRPYSGIKWSEAYNIANGIENSTTAKTYLCSSYAWDTAVNFIQNHGVKADRTTKASDYGSNREGYNANWRDMSVMYNENGVNKTKAAGTAQTLNTGLTTPVCNIYDMAGNAGEFTTEINPNTGEACIVRSASYDNVYFAAGGRWDVRTNSTAGFRATLFLKT